MTPAIEAAIEALVDAVAPVPTKEQVHSSTEYEFWSDLYICTAWIGAFREDSRFTMEELLASRLPPMAFVLDRVNAAQDRVLQAAREDARTRRAELRRGVAYEVGRHITPTREVS